MHFWYKRGIFEFAICQGALESTIYGSDLARSKKINKFLRIEKEDYLLKL